MYKRQLQNEAIVLKNGLLELEHSIKQLKIINKWAYQAQYQDKQKQQMEILETYLKNSIKLISKNKRSGEPARQAQELTRIISNKALLLIGQRGVRSMRKYWPKAMERFSEYIRTLEQMKHMEDSLKQAKRDCHRLANKLEKISFKLISGNKTKHQIQRTLNKLRTKESDFFNRNAKKDASLEHYVRLFDDLPTKHGLTSTARTINSVALKIHNRLSQKMQLNNQRCKNKLSTWKRNAKKAFEISRTPGR